jgi:hypothetical protein
MVLERRFLKNMIYEKLSLKDRSNIKILAVLSCTLCKSSYFSILRLQWKRWPSIQNPHSCLNSQNFSKFSPQTRIVTTVNAYKCLQINTLGNESTQFSLCMIKYHAMKMCGGSGGTPNLGTRWRWSASFMAWLLLASSPVATLTRAIPALEGIFKQVKLSP